MKEGKLKKFGKKSMYCDGREGIKIPENETVARIVGGYIKDGYFIPTQEDYAVYLKKK